MEISPSIRSWQSMASLVVQGNRRLLARCISLIENEVPGYSELLRSLPEPANTRVIGITGPPGAGKSTLVDRLIGQWVRGGKKVAVLCVDPSSPFHYGALLGDRIRMSEWYNHPDVFIRSLATRGSLGGLHPKIIEITDLLKTAAFDYILIETVGVGQSEVEIAGLADCTVVVLVPEAGDEIQTMKAGLMEIAGVFAVNKCDRPGADLFVRNLRQIITPGDPGKAVEIVKTIASRGEGIEELAGILVRQHPPDEHRKNWLLAEKAYQLIVYNRMRDTLKLDLLQQISIARQRPGFNLYRFIENYAAVNAEKSPPGA